MATEFLLPDLGEDIDEADVLKVLVSPGQTVALEQPVLEIETDKATLDVPSSFAGTIVEIHVSEGDTIHPGQLIITIDQADGAPSPEATPATASADAPPPEQPQPPQAATAEPTHEPAVAAASSPAASAPAAEAQQPAEGAPPPPSAEAAPLPPQPGGRAAFAAPSVRKFAREVGVEISRVSGSGPGGRISEDDVKRHARGRAAAPPAAADGGPVDARPAPELPDFSQWGHIDREPLTRFRRTVVRNMSEAWEQIPHFWLHHSVDVTELEEMRQNFKERASEAGGALTVTVIMLKILAGALKANPKFNASLDSAANELVFKRYYNIGVAVDTDRGLVVPVLRDVDEKNIIELSVELKELSKRARNNELAIEDMRGGTFTLTNLGGMGTGHFTAVIHHPEVAILGLGRAQQTPVLDEAGQWQPRLMMPITIGCDHRVIDGADGARFINWIAEAIDQPFLLAL